MITRSTTRAATLVLFSLLSSVSHAALLSRAGGQAYYDTDLNITWLADANLSDTNDFGVAGISFFGTATWDIGIAWVEAMSVASYLGVSTWRLPSVTDTGPPGCTFTAADTGDCGFFSNNTLDPDTGEMAHLFNVTLGNSAGLTNTGPFSNLQAAGYWYGQESPDSTGAAWYFGFADGQQNENVSKVSGGYLWPVLDGDIAAVPAPPSLWLLGTAILAVGGRLRRRIGSRARTSSPATG